MKKILLILPALLILTACNTDNFSFDEPITGHEISSEDGKAHINIPEGALPDGISATDLKIQKKPMDDGSIAYSLEPDGTQFKKPVMVSVEVDDFKATNGFYLPLITLMSNEKEEYLNEVSVTSHPSFSNLLVQANVPHFSYLKIKKDAMMEMTLSSPNGKYQLKEVVPVEGDIKLARQDSNLSNFSARVFMREVPDDKILSPNQMVKVISSPQNLQFNEKLDFYSNQYKCAELGKTNVKVLLPVRFDINSDFTDFLYKFYIYTDKIECIDGKKAEETSNEISAISITSDSIYLMKKNEGDATKKKEEKKADAKEKPLVNLKPEYEATFEHVKPGEYSEVYLSVTKLRPGEKVVATLWGSAVDGNTDQAIIADKNGVAHFTWKILAYGNYEINLKHGLPDEKESTTSTINLTVN